MASPNSGLLLKQIIDTLVENQELLDADLIISRSKTIKFKIDNEEFGRELFYYDNFNLAQASMYGLFSHPDLQNLNKAIESLYLRAEEFRLNKSFKFHHLLDDPMLYLDCIESIGFPLTYNPTQDANGNVNPDYIDRSFINVNFHHLMCLRAVVSIYDTLDGYPECDLLTYCRDIVIGLDEDICTNSPWRMAERAPCPYAQLWTLFGFPQNVDLSNP